VGRKTSSLKLACLNIEKFAHVDQIIPALRDGNFDVICLQEVPEDLLSILASRLSASMVFFEPMARIPKTLKNENSAKQSGNDKFISGLALIVRRGRVSSNQSLCYRRNSQGIPVYKEKSCRSNYFVQSVVVKKDGREYRIGHTHFTWSANGIPTPEQGRDIQEMLRLCRKFPDLVLCGDFNMPRGGMLWSLMSDVYKDNIPPEELSTLDEVLHRAEPLQLVVDGLFTTPHYEVSRIELFGGISDHKLISAVIVRK
jgi:endonuclease/exonuclease/phosphatase family metal-dependent hydrolase